MYAVNIKDMTTGKNVESIEASTLRAAERVERGVNINLNHGEYYTEIEEL